MTARTRNRAIGQRLRRFLPRFSKDAATVNPGLLRMWDTGLASVGHFQRAINTRYTNRPIRLTHRLQKYALVLNVN
jgi:hypothetical protein